MLCALIKRLRYIVVAVAPAAAVILRYKKRITLSRGRLGDQTIRRSAPRRKQGDRREERGKNRIKGKNY